VREKNRQKENPIQTLASLLHKERILLTGFGMAGGSKGREQRECRLDNIAAGAWWWARSERMSTWWCSGGVGEIRWDGELMGSC
jgi:hypothetical protein